MRALDTRLKQTQTFFDDATPVDSRRSGEHERYALRDSHDLSFADGTRDSVVDNMLLSLDQLPALSTYPAALYSNFDDVDFFLADNTYPPAKATRHRGHTYASSHSSDYDLHADDASSRYSTHQSRGRRSNSSNNIPNTMGRRESLRGMWSGSKQTNGVSNDYQQTGHIRGGGKSSKGSVSSSVDFGHGGMGAHRLAVGRRSASFDHGNLSSRTAKAESILERKRSNYTNYRPEYEAAPQPTIPAGPRRIQEPQSPVAFPPQPSYAPPQAPAPRRKNSVRSTASYKTLRKNKSHPEPNMRQQAQEFVNAHSLRDLPPIPTFQDPPAPSPTVATRKHTLIAPNPASAPKEKPGFFRRVFGSSLPKSMPQLSSSSSSSPSISRTHPPSVPSNHRPADVESVYSHGRPRTTPNGSNHIASQLKSAPARPPQTANSAQPQQPTLTKKHSSFFRRRKKSVTETPQPPPMPVEFQPVPKPEALSPQSPGISSLRKVMNPYLGDMNSPVAKYYDAREFPTPTDEAPPNGRQNGFSPGYKPHKDATVRTVKPGSRGTDNSPPSSQEEQLKVEQVATTNSPKLKLKMKNHRANVANTQEDTFLADSSSGNEDRSGRVTPSDTFVDADETPRPASSPTTYTFPPNDVDNNITPSGPKTTGMLGSQPADVGDLTASSRSASEVELEDEGWILTTPSKSAQVYTHKNASRSKRVWLEPTSSEERLAGDDGEDLSLPLEGASGPLVPPKPSEKERPASAPEAPLASANGAAVNSSNVPTVQVEVENEDNMPAIIEHRIPDDEPTEADRERAFRIFNGDDPSVQKGQAAAILGDVTLASSRIRKAFMDLFQWSGFNVLAAMRDLCGKLVLKAETQQVDRILMSLSERWCECNPNHGFKALGKYS